jgi:hypothetical protein
MTRRAEAGSGGPRRRHGILWIFGKTSSAKTGRISGHKPKKFSRTVSVAELAEFGLMADYHSA